MSKALVMIHDDNWSEASAGERMLIFTPLLRCYLDHGMEVTQLYQIIEYALDRCFLPSVKEVIEA